MSVRLFVLGILAERDAHGYEIKEIGRAWKLDKWADVGFGSIYHALARLQEEGLIRELRTEQEGDRPPRSVYRITPAGRETFRELVRETCRSVQPERRAIDLALQFLAYLPAEERIALLQQRLAALEQRLRAAPARREELKFLEISAPWVGAALEHHLAHLELEVRWTRELLQQVGQWPARECQNEP